MSKNKNFGKQQSHEHTLDIENVEVVNEVTEEVLETPIEETVDNVETSEEIAETIEEPVVEEAIEETSEEIQLEVIGTVEGCELLNVRSKPEADAEIVTVIPVDSIVTVSDVNASPDFYKVLIGDLEGFCMKKFIKIKE